MVNEGAVFKALIAPGVVFVGAELVPRLLHGGAEALALTAAATAGSIYLGRGIRRTWRHGRAFIARALETFDIVESTPENFDEVHARLDRHRSELIELRTESKKQGEALGAQGKALDVLADAERHRIQDAVAGDRRSPVDRRERPAA